MSLPPADVPGALAGETFTITHRKHTVTVTELGAGLRSYRVGGVEFLDGYPPDGYPTASSYGQVLAPWPNRIDRGTYTFEGTEQQLPWNETDKQNAIHGLTRWMNWERHERTSTPYRCTSSYTLNPATRSRWSCNTSTRSGTTG